MFESVKYIILVTVIGLYSLPWITLKILLCPNYTFLHVFFVFHYFKDLSFHWAMYKILKKKLLNAIWFFWIKASKFVMLMSSGPFLRCIGTNLWRNAFAKSSAKTLTSMPSATSSEWRKAQFSRTTPKTRESFRCKFLLLSFHWKCYLEVAQL